MPKAKYEGIYRSIKKRIEAQDYPYQSLLPSENTLIEEYDCSRNTVRRAIAELIADGYVQAMQGRGVRVIYQPVGKTTFTIGGIETFQETARRNHLQAVTRVIRFETITATEQFAAESGFSEGFITKEVFPLPDFPQTIHTPRLSGVPKASYHSPSKGSVSNFMESSSRTPLAFRAKVLKSFTASLIVPYLLSSVWPPICVCRRARPVSPDGGRIPPAAPRAVPA